MNFGLKGKGVLITGGNGGIGNAIVAAFKNEGARVHFTYHSNTESAEATCQKYQTEPPIALDLLDSASINAAFDSASSAGGVDVLVNNAVLWRASPKSENPVFDMFRANIDGQYQLTKLALESMLEKSWGRIVNVSSNIAEDGMLGSVLYSTSKSALHGMMASLKWDAGLQGVLINTVMPGLTMTDRAKTVVPEKIREQERLLTPSGQLSKPDDVANTVAFLGSAANANISGELLRVTGGK